MADNYLEKRYEEVFKSGKAASSHRAHQGIDVLLRRNRSYRGYDKSYEVKMLQMESIVRVNTMIPTARNQQALRFKIITKGPESDLMQGKYALGRALPELHLPFPGTEPEAFIIVCSEAEQDGNLFIDLGISLQSMLLKAVDLGLVGIIIRNFNHSLVQKTFGLPCEPLAIVAIGKGAETIELVPIHEGESLDYYRKEGVHYVPKLTLEDILL